MNAKLLIQQADVFSGLLKDIASNQDNASSQDNARLFFHPFLR